VWWIGVTFGVSIVASGGVGEGVMEGAQGVLALDGHLEAIAGLAVGDRDGDRVRDRVPEQADVDAIVLAGVELTGAVEVRAVVEQSVSHVGELAAAGPDGHQGPTLIAHPESSRRSLTLWVLARMLRMRGAPRS
jgi:hypothetical protein